MRRFSFALLYVLAFSLNSVTAKEPVYEIGHVIFPPYIDRDAKGKLFGSWVEAFQTVLDKANLNYQFTYYPASRYYRHTLDGKIEISLINELFKDPDNALLVSHLPISDIDLRVFWLQDHPPITQVEQLAYQPIVLLRGYQYGGIIDNLLENEETRQYFNYVNDHDSAISMLEKERGKYFLGYWRVVKHLMKGQSHMQLNNLKLRKINIHIAVHKKAPNAINLYNQINEIIASLKPAKEHIPASAETQNTIYNQ